MARISPIPVEQWPDEMDAFKRGPLSDVERDVLGVHAYLPATAKAF